MQSYAPEFIFVLILLICLALILPMRSYATRVGEKPSLWLSPLAISWGFLWVLLSRINWKWFTDGYTFWWKWGAFLLFGLITYLLFWWRLRKKAKQNLATKIDEIGKKRS